MLKKEIIARFFFFPFAFLGSVLDIANNKARAMYLHMKFSNADIATGVCITSDSFIGDAVLIQENSIINHSCVGKYSYISRGALIQNTTIGNYCSISHDFICGLGSHPLDLVSTSPLFYKTKNCFKRKIVQSEHLFAEYSPIIIGNDVWIGARVIVMDGIKIGNGAVVAAGAVVTKDVPDYAIVGGIPAKILRYRFNEAKIKSLQESRWWDLDPNEAYLKIQQIQ